MASTTPLESWTLRKTLEHQRLVLRLGRLERVVAALQQRADAREAGERVPVPLRLALDDFRRELREVRSQLAGVDDRLHRLAPTTG